MVLLSGIARFELFSRLWTIDNKHSDILGFAWRFRGITGLFLKIYVNPT